MEDFIVKKYEALELEIIAVDTDVVLGLSFGENNKLDTPMTNIDVDYNPLKDLGIDG